MQIYRYRYCDSNFEFNNRLYKYIRTIYNSKQSSRVAIKTTSTSIVLVISIIVIKVEILELEDTKESEIIFYTSKIIYFNITDFSKEDYTFQDYRFVIALIIFVLADVDYELYFDIKYIISFIDRKFLLEILLEISIKKITIFIII